MIVTILLLVVLVFMAYSLFAYYQSTPAVESIPKRVWLSLLAASAAVGAAVASWFHSGATPPP